MKLRAMLLCLSLCGIACGGEDTTITIVDPDPDNTMTDGGTDVVEPGVCGDGACNYQDGSESCVTCPADCGQCLSCGDAPTCSGVLGIPVGSEQLSSFNANLSENDNATVEALYTEGMPLGDACRAPLLRLRLRQIRTIQNGSQGFGGTLINMACSVTVSDGTRSELFVTPLMEGIGDDGQPRTFDAFESIVWGKADNNAIAPSMQNLSVAMQCVESAEAGSSFLETLSDAAELGGGVAGESGWIFDTVEGAADIANGLLTGGNELLVDVKQTIDSQTFYELTNGRIWRITKEGDGGGLNEQPKIEFEFEAWGCAHHKDDLL